MAAAPKYDYSELSRLLDYSDELQEYTTATMLKALRALLKETERQKAEIEALKAMLKI